jgi:hypothetical protein
MPIRVSASKTPVRTTESGRWAKSRGRRANAAAAAVAAAEDPGEVEGGERSAAAHSSQLLVWPEEAEGGEHDVAGMDRTPQSDDVPTDQGEHEHEQVEVEAEPSA